MKALDAIKDRRAVRAFRGDRITDSVLVELIKISTNAPSFMNQQPWAYSVIQDPKSVSRLGSRVREYLRLEGRQRLPFPMTPQCDSLLPADIFYGAPALVVISATTGGRSAELACAMAAYALMLAAVTMNLGVCWVSDADSWFATSEGRKALGIPDSYHPVATLLVGAPMAAPVSPGRFDPEVHWVNSDALARKRAESQLA